MSCLIKTEEFTSMTEINPILDRTDQGKIKVLTWNRHHRYQIIATLGKG